VDLERVVKEVGEGRLVEVRFLSDQGRETGSTGDHPCADARAEGERFAFFPAFDACGHAIDVDRLEEEGDETYLHGHVGDMRVRLRVSPVWTGEQREILKAWAKEKDARFVGGEIGRVLA
jgi:hypothetical protein